MVDTNPPILNYFQSHFFNTQNKMKAEILELWWSIFQVQVTYHYAAFNLVK
jgi:hypothetical protein